LSEINGFYDPSRREPGLTMNNLSPTPALGFHPKNFPMGKSEQANAASRLSVRINDIYA